jgi:hypothetical protein
MSCYDVNQKQEHVHMGDGIAALVLERSTRPPAPPLQA